MNIFCKFLFLIFVLCTALIDLIATIIKLIPAIILLFLPDGLMIFLKFFDLDIQTLSEDLGYMRYVLKEFGN